MLPSMLRAFTLLTVCSVPVASMGAQNEELQRLNSDVQLCLALPDPGDGCRVATGSTLSEIVKARFGLMTELSKRDPRAASAYTLTERQTTLIRERTAALQPYLEERGDWTGVARVVIEDDIDSGRSRTWLDVETADGRRMAPTERSTNIRSGDLVNVHGIAVGGTVLPLAIKRAYSVAAQQENTIGEQRTAVVLLHYPGMPAPALSAADVQQLAFGATAPSLTSYWRDVSGGKTWAAGEVFGWITADLDYGCNIQAIHDAVVERMFPDLRQRYARIFILFSQNRSGTCGFTAQGMLGSAGGSSTSWIPVYDGIEPTRLVRLMAHEGGHNLGLGHGRTRTFAQTSLGSPWSRGDIFTYGDPYSVMGSGDGHYAASHKMKLGWFVADSDVQTVEGAGLVTVLPSESTEAGPKAVRIRRHADPESWLWVEYRQRLGYDSGLDEDAVAGALIYYHDPHTVDSYDGEGSDLLLFGSKTTKSPFPLAVGTTWSDAYSGLMLKVESATAGRVVIRVDRRQGCTAIAEPVATHAPAGGTGMIVVTAPANCPWTAVADDPWIHLGQTVSGSGSAVIDYLIDENSGAKVRRGGIGLSGTAVEVRQAAFMEAPVAWFGGTTGSKPTIGTGTYPYGYGLNLYYSDPNGPDEVRWFRVAFNGAPHEPGGCVIEYDRMSGTLSLRSDDGSQSIQSAALGASGEFSLQNSQCSVSRVFLHDGYAPCGSLPESFRAEVHVAFSRTFAAATNVFVAAKDQGGLDSGWIYGGRFHPADGVFPVALHQGGVVDAASFQPKVSPNSWATAFGTNLSRTTQMWTRWDFKSYGLGVPPSLPTSLMGTDVQIGGKFGYVAFVSPAQVNFLVPGDVPPGPAVTQINVSSWGSTAPVTVEVTAFSPSFFLFAVGGWKYVAATHADGTLAADPDIFSGAAAATRARVGETVQLFGTGFGPTTPPYPVGNLISKPYPTTNPATVTIGGVQATVQFCGLVGAGLYQLNVVVPQLPEGDHAVVARIGGVASQPNVLMSVRR